MIFKKSTYDWLIVGLGNPGAEYEKTRHNAGFMAVDLLADKEDFKFTKRKFNGVCGEFKLKDKRILVLKPETFMNNSGTAVAAAKNFYKIPLENIIILCDDMMLDVGKIRIRRKGSHGGHNGIRDIIEHLGTEEFARIKIGVGKKPRPDYDVISWVLGKFPQELSEDLDKSIERSVKAIKEIISRGIDSAMNKYNN
ncbi:MAG: aminoacyl-tRNA hydrolase [Clostridia bacterium]|nr:aminoacyl-tRNA hydrolase [Clostridia bacterium]